jgi:hypothetical protein
MATYICQECEQKFFSWKEFDSHTSRHIQTHLDKWKTKIPEKKTPSVSITNIPEAMNRDLYKVFEKYNLGSKTMLCLWRNGQLNCAGLEPAREEELRARLNEWLDE